MPDNVLLLIFLGILVIFVAAIVFRSVIMVHQGYTVIVERLGRYKGTFQPGLHFLVPFLDNVRQKIDMREQVVPFPPQPVITSDNISVNIDTVIYYQVTNPEAATYEIANPMSAIEQLAVTTLRNIIGSMDMEQALTGRDQINGQLRGVLDEATGRWGIRVNRVELKAIDPPSSVQSAMEQQMKAERDRRAAILTAEGIKQSNILTAEGEKQAAILRAESDKQSTILRAEGKAQSAILQAQGESRAITQVFDAIHRGNPDPKLLSYQYIRMLPELAKSESNKMWIVPTELTAALDSIAGGFGYFKGGAPDGGTPDGGGSNGAGFPGAGFPGAIDEGGVISAEGLEESLAAGREKTSDHQCGESNTSGVGSAACRTDSASEGSALSGSNPPENGGTTQHNATQNGSEEKMDILDELASTQLESIDDAVKNAHADVENAGNLAQDVAEIPAPRPFDPNAELGQKPN